MEIFKSKDEEIAYLEERLKLLKEEKAFSENPEYKLAELLHAKLCHSNHTDQCGWDYESWENLGNARSTYLSKAKNVLKIVTPNAAKKIINVL